MISSLAKTHSLQFYNQLNFFLFDIFKNISLLFFIISFTLTLIHGIYTNRVIIQVLYPASLEQRYSKNT